MKLKPLYIYGILFVIIIAVIVFTSTENNKKMVTIPSSNGVTQMPTDAIHQGMNGMPSDAIHQGVSGMRKGGAPSKSNVRKDFWVKMDKYKADIEANPNDTLTMKNYAEMLGMSHKTNEAIRLYEKILAINPNRTDILLAEGLVFYNSQNYKMAEVVTKKIIKMDDNNLEAKYNLGVIAAVQGNSDEAKKVWKELSKKYPDEEVGKLAAKSLEQISKE